VGLGSNLGDPVANLAEARRRLASVPGVEIEAASPVYRTEPQGVKDQPWFANQVLRVLCNGPGALDLLAALAAVEQDMGRKRGAGEGERFGPRIIDLDILLFGDEVRDNERLALPHTRMRERAFVLVPLADLVPDLVFPDGETISDALDKLDFLRDGDAIHQPAPTREHIGRTKP
jgi:2-amino-4-hydroxy-6-hydroxymethyldihydropteridine diphosphokinase